LAGTLWHTKQQGLKRSMSKTFDDDGGKLDAIRSNPQDESILKT